MMPLGELFVHVYVLVADAVAGGQVAIPWRPGPTPACSDAEAPTLAVVRHVLGRPSERAWLAEVRRDRRAYCPHLPGQSGFNRRVRWLWGACELLRQRLVARTPEDAWQRIDTTALPVKPASRVPGPDAWDGPAGLRAGFGCDAAQREWFYGFRLGLRADLGRRLVRAWAVVPAAVDERAVADALLDGASPAGLLLDRGFVRRTWADAHRRRGIRVAYAHSKADRQRLPRAVRRPVAALRNRIGTTIGELTDRSGLARHGARTFLGLLARSAATLLAHTLLRLGRA
jgi:hypothetical protein